MKIKLIHPKTHIEREVDESRHNKIQILKRAGFIEKSKYRPPKREKQPPPPPSVAEVVEKHKQEIKESELINEPEIAIHMSAAARKLVEKYDLDPTEIEGTGVDGQINKPDVKDYLEENPPEPAKKDDGDADGKGEGENPAEAQISGQAGDGDDVGSAKDIKTHDDDPEGE